MKNLFVAIALIFSATLQAGQTDLQLVGQARLKFMFWSVYDSRLLSTDGSYSEGQRPLRLDIEYLLAIESDKLVERTASEWQSQGLYHARQQQWLDALASLWPDVDERDTISLELDAEERSTFYRNGELLGTIQDPEFGKHFLDIWLSPNTSRPELRLALTGQR